MEHSREDRGREEGSTDGGQPSPPQHPSPQNTERQTTEAAGKMGRKAGGTGGGRERRRGEEQKIQSQVGGNPIQSNPNQNFKPYLRCLTSGEPDLGKGKGRKKERRKKKRREKEEKGKETKKTRVIKISQREGRKKLLLPQFKNPF